MKLISKTRIRKEADVYFEIVEWENEYSLSVKSFEKGVDFAETELQNLAIEFTEWKDKNYNTRVFSDCIEYDTYSRPIMTTYSTSELFNKFIEQRKL